jgi:hypothetical protein
MGASAVLTTEAFAQTPPAAKETIAIGDFQFSPLLQVRTRGEYRRDPVDIGGRQVTSGPELGALGAHVTDAVAFMTRARLGLGAERGAIKAQITLQDARAFGSSPPTALIDPTRTSFGVTGVYETYIEIHTTGPQRPTYLRVGRQAIEWGDGRLLGKADFSPTGRVLDAARLHWSTGVWDFEALASMLDSPRPLGVAFADASAQTATWGAQLYGLLGHWAIGPLLRVEAMGLARVVSRRSALSGDGSVFSLARSQGETYTASLRIHGEAKGWAYSAMGAIQGGTVRVPGFRTSERLAGAAAAKVGKTFDGLIGTPTFQVVGSFATGDTGSGSYGQFDPLLPDVHTHHGLLNVFALSNLFDIGGKATIVPFRDGTISAEYRHAQLLESNGEWINGYLFAVSGPRGGGLFDLGHEIDIAFRWHPHPALDIAAGYGALILGDAARAAMRAVRRGDVQPDGSIAPADLSHFGYLQATVDVP